MVVLIPTAGKVPMAIWSMVRLGAGVLAPLDFKYLDLVIQDCSESNDCQKCLNRMQCAKLYDDLKLKDKFVTGPH